MIAGDRPGSGWSPAACFRRLRSQAVRRVGWGVADQAVSSLTNFAVSIYVARTLGAAQLGAFSLAYVTYGFALNASRGLATDPLMVRFSGKDLPTWRRSVASCAGTAAIVGVAAGICVLCGGRAGRRHGWGRISRARTYAAGTDAARQLALLVLRARPWRLGISQRHHLGGDPATRPGAPAGNWSRERVLVRPGVGGGGGPRCRIRPAAGPGRAQALWRGGLAAAAS